MKARTGKIARLPRRIREELNVRMADGESGKALVAWLNAQPEVNEVLARDFAGRPVLEQNLSEWRRGGHREWCAQRELADEWSLHEECEGEDLRKGGARLSDRLSRILTSRYTRLIAATCRVADWSKPRNRAMLRELCEEIAIIRRLDQGAARLNLEIELLEIRKEEVRLEREVHLKRTHAEWRQWTRAAMDEILQASKTPEEALRQLMILLHGHADEEMIDEERRRLRAKAGLKPLSEHASLLEKMDDLMNTHVLAEEKRSHSAKQDQSESNPIKP